MFLGAYASVIYGVVLDKIMDHMAFENVKTSHTLLREAALKIEVKFLEIF